MFSDPSPLFRGYIHILFKGIALQAKILNLLLTTFSGLRRRSFSWVRRFGWIRRLGRFWIRRFSWVGRLSSVGGRVSVTIPISGTIAVAIVIRVAITVAITISGTIIIAIITVVVIAITVIAIVITGRGSRISRSCLRLCRGFSFRRGSIRNNWRV